MQKQNVDFNLKLIMFDTKHATIGVHALCGHHPSTRKLVK